MTKKLFKTLLTVLLLSNISSAFANDPYGLTACITDNTSGKDRKQLAIWIFTAMSYHPEIDAIVKMQDPIKTESEKNTGAIFNKLLTQDCAEQVKIAKEKDPQAIQIAFEQLGRLAMMELMANPAVGKAMSGPGKYVDPSVFGQTK